MADLHVSWRSLAVRFIRRAGIILTGRFFTAGSKQQQSVITLSTFTHIDHYKLEAFPTNTKPKSRLKPTPYTLIMLANIAKTRGKTMTTLHIPSIGVVVLDGYSM